MNYFQTITFLSVEYSIK
ncbi:hypothetical protein EII17_14555 [Clostridiales bacterium COT073_COT-073]|nr:hypothetical protein EII17_14555 [Clostridiales bacterium COT073_COT-073]